MLFFPKTLQLPMLPPSQRERCAASAGLASSRGFGAPQQRAGSLGFRHGLFGDLKSVKLLEGNHAQQSDPMIPPFPGFTKKKSSRFCHLLLENYQLLAASRRKDSLRCFAQATSPWTSSVGQRRRTKHSTEISTESVTHTVYNNGSCGAFILLKLLLFVWIIVFPQIAPRHIGTSNFISSSRARRLSPGRRSRFWEPKGSDFL